MTDPRPVNCRFRLQEEGKGYPRSSCQACGKTITTGLGRSCSKVKTYTEAEVQAMVAAAVMEAAGVAGERASLCGVREISGLIKEHIVRALIRPDAMAALHAYRDREVAKALKEARLAFENVDCQVEDAGEFTERSWEQLRAAMTPEVKP